MRWESGAGRVVRKMLRSWGSRVVPANQKLLCMVKSLDSFLRGASTRTNSVRRMRLARRPPRGFVRRGQRHVRGALRRPMSSHRPSLFLQAAWLLLYRPPTAQACVPTCRHAIELGLSGHAIEQAMRPIWSWFTTFCGVWPPSHSDWGCVWQWEPIRGRVGLPKRSV